MCFGCALVAWGPELGVLAAGGGGGYACSMLDGRADASEMFSAWPLW